jgi:anti-anti-sigma factor
MAGQRTPLVSVNTANGATVLTLTGRFDAGASDAVSTAVLDAVATARALVVDLHAVTYMASTVIGTLLFAVRRMKAEQLPVAVVLPAGDARQVFELVGLTLYLPTHPTLAAALRAVRA